MAEQSGAGDPRPFGRPACRGGVDRPECNSPRDAGPRRGHRSGSRSRGAIVATGLLLVGRATGRAAWWGVGIAVVLGQCGSSRAWARASRRRSTARRERRPTRCATPATARAGALGRPRVWHERVTEGVHRAPRSSRPRARVTLEGSGGIGIVARGHFGSLGQHRSRPPGGEAHARRPAPSACRTPSFCLGAIGRGGRRAFGEPRGLRDQPAAGLPCAS